MDNDGLEKDIIDTGINGANTDEEREALSEDKKREAAGLMFYIKLCWPMLIFPLLYFPYSRWWRVSFAEMAIRLTHRFGSQFMRLMITGNNTILLFWCIVTAITLLVSIIVAVIRVRPWYAIPIYISVIFSLCGICSILFYNWIVR